MSLEHSTSDSYKSRRLHEKSINLRHGLLTTDRQQVQLLDSLLFLPQLASTTIFSTSPLLSRHQHFWKLHLWQLGRRPRWSVVTDAPRNLMQMNGDSTTTSSASSGITSKWKERKSSTVPIVLVL